MPGITDFNRFPRFTTLPIQITSLILLVLCCGFADAQQAGGFNDGSRAQAQNASTPDPARRFGPLEMVLNDELIASFKRQGQLSAMVEPREFVNEILFLYEGNDNQQNNQGRRNSTGTNITGVMTPVAKLGSTLAFELDDFDIDTIKIGGLKYTFDQNERGRFESVRVDYKRPSATSGSSNAANNSNFGSGRTDSNLVDNRQPNRFLPVPAPEFSMPGERNFMGPTMQPIQRNPPQQNFNPSNPSRDLFTQETTQRNQTASRPAWEPSPTQGTQFNNQFDNRPPSNNSQFANNPPNGGYNSNTQWNNQPFNPQPNNFQQNQPTAAMIAAEDVRRKQEELDFRRNMLAKNEQFLEEQKLAAAEQQAQQRQQAFLEEQQRLFNEQEQAKREHLRAFDSFQGLASNRIGNVNYGDTLTTGYRSPPSRSVNDDLAPQPTDGVRGMAASIQAPNGNSTTATKPNTGMQQAGLIGNGNNNTKTESLIYFMLLFSLGLNIYLGWIARGFYVRYEELADELRETFTATM